MELGKGPARKCRPRTVPWHCRVLLALALAGPAAAGAAAAPASVVRIELDSIIHPVAAGFVAESLQQAEQRGAQLLVVELDTPGGLLTSTHEISTAMLGSSVPVVVYVAPSGARAASAGFFLLMAADVAAMAPGTNTGAAHPVGPEGRTVEGAMGEKLEQDAAATIRSLAGRHDRNAALAEKAVLESRSFTAEEALDQHLIDVVAADLPDLLARLDGRTIVKNGAEHRLATAGAPVQTLEMSGLERFLSALAHPDLAYLLMTLGGLGLFFELSHPGAVLPGVVGGICLILALFALSVLPVSYAGVALILLALIFFVAEVKVTSYGLLTIGGIISLVIGSLMLFRGSSPALRVSLDVIATVAIFSAAVVVSLMLLALRAHRQQVRTGREGLVHERGVARTAISPRGKVFVHGEIWDAVSPQRIEAGEMVEVVGVEGMRLEVEARSAPTTFERGGET